MSVRQREKRDTCIGFKRIREREREVIYFYEREATLLMSTLVYLSLSIEV